MASPPRSIPQVGEIWYVDLSTDVVGREQSKDRPGIIMAKHHTYIYQIIPLTSSLGALRLAATKLINATKQNGLNTDSVALIFQMRAVDQQRLKWRVGILEDNILQEIKQELMIYLNLNSN